MKKYFIIAVAALAASVACTKTEVNDTPGERITFEPASYVPQTKAHALGDESITAFNCMAFMKGAGVSGYQNFFGTTGETISFKSATNTWEPSHDYYWPKGAESFVNFFSWYDTSAAPTVTNDGTTATMTWTNRTIGISDNIMYADPAWHFKENTTQADQYTGDATHEGVPTIFHHALAQVVFQAYATKTSISGLCNWTIQLTDVKITNVYNKGSLELTATEPAASTLNTKGTWSGTPAWTVSGSASDLEPSNLSVTSTDSNNPNTILANQVVLPQSLTNVHLTFNLDITTTYTAGQTNHEIIPIDIPLAGTTGFNTAAWALNHKYTYIVKIEPSENKVLFDPAIEEEWVVESSVEKAI